MTSMTSTTDSTPSGGSRVSSDRDGVTFDVSGLTPAQVAQVNTVVHAMVVGVLDTDEAWRLLEAGTPSEVAQEAGRRLTVTGRTHLLAVTR